MKAFDLENEESWAADPEEILNTTPETPRHKPLIP